MKLAGDGTRIWTRATRLGRIHKVGVDRGGNVYGAGGISFGGTGHVRFLADGILDWERGPQYIQDISVMSDGTHYICGSTGGGLSGRQFLLAKCFASSTPGGTEVFGPGNGDAADSCEAYNTNFVYVAGRTSGEFDGQTNAFPNWALCLVRYSPSLAREWTRIVATAENEWATHVAVDAGGNAYVVGAAFGPMHGQPYAGGSDICLLKYTPAGDHVWSRVWGSAEHDSANSVAVDATGTVFVTGQTFGTLDGEANRGAGDIFVTAFSASGAKLWTSVWGTPGEDHGADIAAGGRNILYVVGKHGNQSYITKIAPACVSGKIFYEGRQQGPVRVLADIENGTWTSEYETVVSQPGSYGITNALLGTNYYLRAYRDSDGNGTNDPWEAQGSYASNPLYLTNSIAGIDIHLAESDSDHDGMPDWWERKHGLSWTNSLDAERDLDGDGLANRLEYGLASDPCSTNSDGDALSDYDEFATYGTDASREDTDRDGMPDDWEVLHGLDPTVDDSAGDRDLDWVSNLDEHAVGLNPGAADTDGDGTNDFMHLAGKGGAKYFYDRTDRLVGVEYDNGRSIGYAYDGNGNMIREAHLDRDEDGDRLPDLWEFLNGLSFTNAVGDDGATGDSDKDGWSNLQEWLAGGTPAAAEMSPGDSAGIYRLSLGFDPARFVMAVGQVDADSRQKIVVGADGNPNGHMNRILVLTPHGAGWSSEQINVGSVGVSSIAVGNPGNRPLPCVYVGTRSVNGRGSIMEFQDVFGRWVSNVVAISTGAVAHVLGVREGSALVASLAPALGTGDGLYSLMYSNASWTARRIASCSPRGLSDPSMAAGALMPGEKAAFLCDDMVLQSGQKLETWSLDEFGGDSADLNEWGDNEWNEWLIQIRGAYYPGHLSAKREDGMLKLTCSLSAETGSRSLKATRTDIWRDGRQALEFRIDTAGCSGKYANGSADVGLGDGSLFASGVVSYSGVHIHVVRIWDHVFHRHGSTGSWSQWSALSAASTLHFEPRTGRHQATAWLHLDYLRYHSIASLSSEPGPADFRHGDCVYRNTNGVWYVKTTNAMTWARAKAEAEALGGTLVTIQDTEENDWLASEFGEDFWVGLWRPGPSQEWSRADGSVSTFDAWEEADPVAQAGSFAFMSSNGLWSAAAATNEKRGVIAIRDRTMDLSFDPVAALSSGASRIHFGDFVRGGQSPMGSEGEPPVAYAFVSDEDSSGAIGLGDEFRVAEFSKGADGWERATAGSLPVGYPAETYALAYVRADSGSGDILFTAHPEGSIHAWTTGTNGQGRTPRLFSAAHGRRRWHALGAYRSVGGSESLVGLRVDPADSNACDVVLWSDLAPSGREAAWQTAPATRILPVPGSGGGLCRVAVRIWDAEGNRSLPFLQYQDFASSNWLDAALLLLDGRAYSLAMAVDAMPTGTTHMLVWDAAKDLGADFTNSLLLRARSVDVSLWGKWSEPVPYRVEATSDSDGDGLPDVWELANGLDPLASSGRDGPRGDPDGDGIDNVSEYLADTDPSNGSSFLGILGIRAEEGGMRIDWQGGEWSPQYLERRLRLGSNAGPWTAVYTNIPRTDLTNSVLDAGATNRTGLYRIRAERQ